MEVYWPALPWKVPTSSTAGPCPEEQPANTPPASTAARGAVHIVRKPQLLRLIASSERLVAATVANLRALREPNLAPRRRTRRRRPPRSASGAAGRHPARRHRAHPSDLENGTHRIAPRKPRVAPLERRR